MAATAIGAAPVRPSRRAAPGGVAGLAVAVPALALLLLFSLVPLLLLIVQSVTADGTGPGTAAFRSVFGNDVYRSLLWRSLATALPVTVVSVAVAWPVAWTIARHVRVERRNLLLAVVIVPFLTSQLLLIYAMVVLLSAGGPLMTGLVGLGLTEPGTTLLYTPWATSLMFVYESISVIVLILYAATERIDDRLLAASRSLGAGPVRTFLEVVWPHSSTALVSAVSITFVATAGAFAEAAVLGGPDGALIGNVIADRLRQGADEDTTAALAVVLLAASLLVVAALALVIGRIGHPLRPLATTGRRDTP